MRAFPVKDGKAWVRKVGLKRRAIRRKPRKNPNWTQELRDAGRDRCEAVATPFCQQALHEAHHVWPKGMGGSKKRDVYANLLGVCRSCHRWIHAHPAKAYDTQALWSQLHTPLLAKGVWWEENV
jgi:hypothetical protein